MIRSVVYRSDGVEDYDDPDRAKSATGTTWIRVTDPSPADIELLQETFDIHRLSIEDVTSEDTRPKLEEFEDHTLVLVKTAELRRGEVAFSDELRATNVGVFIGPDWVVSLSPRVTDPVEGVWQLIHDSERRILTRGPDFTAYRILDAVVTEYFDILEDIETQIERIEETVIESPDVATLEQINGLRRDLLSVRRLFWPARDVFAVLSRGDPVQIQPETEKYFRDVYDSLIQLVDMTETYRDLVVGTRDIYLNSLSMSTNEVMKKLTVVATIILPLTFVVGVFGMNFAGSPYNMPELTWPYAYPAVLLGMAGTAAMLVWYFARLDWL